MNNSTIYKEIAERTNGDIYIGVVGPVRSGKSTFIKRFMDTLVIPNIENEHSRERAVDELPQSAQGRMIMTTEPKFVPNEAVEIKLEDHAYFRVRMIDCVGYVVEGASGHTEEDGPRMVATPWSDEHMPFEQAAEIGTRKVIKEHSTIGLVVTTDGSICDIPREDYIQAEERVISELTEIEKPFVILLNSAYPDSEHCRKVRSELEEKYNVPVMALSCAAVSYDEINEIIERVLYEFPLKEITINMPSWINSLENEQELRASLTAAALEAMEGVGKIREAKVSMRKLAELESVSRIEIEEINLGVGNVELKLELKEGLFFEIISAESGFEITSDKILLDMFKEFSHMKREYDKIAPALHSVREHGYGIVSPSIEELSLEEPEIIRQGSRYGVSLRASAPSIHMIRADIETEVNPIVGTEKQSEELVHYLLQEFDDEPTKIWASNIFGKSLNELVNEGLRNKLDKMPDDAQMKLRETLTRIINEGSGGLICLIL